MDITNRPKITTSHIGRWHFCKGDKAMFSLSLDSWNTVMIAALSCAALFTVLSVASQYIVIRLQKQTAIQQTQDFEKYKADAAKAVAEADERAESARLEAEKIKQVVAWRIIPTKTASILEKSLSAKPGVVNLRYTHGDPESMHLAIQYSHILGKAGWKVAPGAHVPIDTITFGIALPIGNGTDSETLREAFSAAGIPFATNMAGGLEMNSMISPNAPTLMVGTRPPLSFE